MEALFGERAAEFDVQGLLRGHALPSPKSCLGVPAALQQQQNFRATVVLPLENWVGATCTEGGLKCANQNDAHPHAQVVGLVPLSTAPEPA